MIKKIIIFIVFMFVANTCFAEESFVAQEMREICSQKTPQNNGSSNYSQIQQRPKPNFGEALGGVVLGTFQVAGAVLQGAAQSRQQQQAQTEQNMRSISWFQSQAPQSYGIANPALNSQHRITNGYGKTIGYVDEN